MKEGGVVRLEAIVDDRWAGVAARPTESISRASRSPSFLTVKMTVKLND
jgi:hypothetical protein